MFCSTECWNCEDKTCEHYRSKSDLYFENQQLKQIEKEHQKINGELREEKKELRSWLEESLNDLKQNDVYDRTSYEMGQIIATECIIAKIDELENVKK